MKILLNIFILLLPSLVLAQPSIDRSVIGTAGGNAQTDIIILDYSIGETCIETRIDAHIIITEGFIQGEGYPVGIEFDKLNMSAIVFPNPTTGKLVINIHSEEQSYKEYKFEIIDISGRRLFKKDIKSDLLEFTVEFDLTEYTSGVYYLKILSNGISKNIKIEKFE